MDWKIFATVLSTVFVAELADKTQFTILLFSADKPANKWTVFVASCVALFLATAVAVLAGSWVAQHVNQRYMLIAAGLLFIVIGAWTLRSAYV